MNIHTPGGYLSSPRSGDHSGSAPGRRAHVRRRGGTTPGRRQHFRSSSGLCLKASGRRHGGKGAHLTRARGCDVQHLSGWRGVPELRGWRCGIGRGMGGGVSREAVRGRGMRCASAARGVRALRAGPPEARAARWAAHGGARTCLLMAVSRGHAGVDVPSWLGGGPAMASGSCRSWRCAGCRVGGVGRSGVGVGSRDVRWSERPAHEGGTGAASGPASRPGFVGDHGRRAGRLMSCLGRRPVSGRDGRDGPRGPGGRRCPGGRRGPGGTGGSRRGPCRGR